MVPFFDINNNFAVNHLPNYKRLPKWIQTIRGYLGALVWSDSVFRKYMNGSDDLSFYSSIVTYNKYDKIRDNYAVYESLKGSNLGNPTSDEEWWFKVLDSSIGSLERATYNYRKLKLEFQLNHYFQQQLTENSFVGYQNPTSIDPGIGYLPLSDIYIEYLPPAYLSLLAMDTFIEENTMFEVGAGFYMFEDLILGSATSYTFQINIPTAVYSSINVDPIIAETIVRKFVDRYIKTGTRYVIQTY